jgi:hypothetical protein
MAVVLDLLLFLVVLRAAWRFGRGVKFGMSGPPREPGPPAMGARMVRDPVCGTFLLPERAIALTVGSDRVYFCSAGCRDRYRARTA